jgi:hypothetical protein
MSVEPSEAMSEVWTRWQGDVINGVFPLGRYLGGSDHSGVFLTASAARGPAQLVVKLVPTDRALAESQLPRWRRAGRLDHPHLLRLLEWGGCQLGGLPYLYAVMEYADQTLAQLLLSRALSDDEAREMLLPVLDALAFLHGRKLLQGQLKPANILVLGDRLALASDTIRRAGEDKIGDGTLTVFDPPEATHGSSSTAGDIWALGITLFEAFTRRLPSGSGEHRQTVTLPADFPPAFREIVARCLSPQPHERPSVSELMAWAGAPSIESASAAPIHSEAEAEALLSPEPTLPAPKTPEPATPQPVMGTPATPHPASLPAATTHGAVEAAEPEQQLVAGSPKPGALLAVALGAVVVLALCWMGVRVLTSPRAPTPPAHAVAARDLHSSLSQTPAAAPHPAAQVRPPDRIELTTSQSAVHEVIPDVLPSARHTVHGHIKVWVRVIIERDGSVFAAVTDRAGPSRYFQRLAMEAAKKWTFPPVDTPSRRLMQIRFDFTHSDTTARTVAIGTPGV